MKNKNQLYRYITIAGVIFLFAGLVGLYFFVVKGLKPDFLQLNVFTLYSKYLDSKKFTFILNSQGDELSVFLYFVGWILLLFSFKKTWLCKEILFVFLYVIAYLLLHGIVIVYVTFAFLFLTPVLFIRIFKKKEDG